MGGCQGPSREVLKAAGLRQARWRPDQRLRLLVHTDALWREDFHRLPTASVGSHLIAGHGCGISASPPPPPTQQSSWRAALVPPIRDHYVDSPPPRTAVWTPPFSSPTPSQPPQAVTSLRSPASFFPCRLPPRRLRSPRVSFSSPLQPLLHTAVILCAPLCATLAPSSPSAAPTPSLRAGRGPPGRAFLSPS